MQEWEHEGTGQYKLIDLDKDESSIVRRALYQRSEAGEQVIRQLVRAMQQQEPDLSNIQIMRPRWEASVHPLYYWAFKELARSRGGTGNDDACFNHVLSLLPTLSGQELRHALGYTVVHCEIDILVEDFDYFLFLEVKMSGSEKINWYKNKRGVHQLVHQYVQGSILSKLVPPHKRFALATVGASNGKTHKIPLNDRGRALLGLVGYNKPLLEIIDLPLTILTGAGQSAQ